MPGVSEREFLDRIRKAMGHHITRSDAPADHDLARTPMVADSPVEQFCLRVEQSGMKLRRVRNEDQLVNTVAEIVRESGLTAVFVPGEQIPARADMERALRDAGCAFVAPDDREEAFRAEVGITGAAGAIAETGSIVVRSGGPSRVLASLTVKLHVAVVRSEQIMPDLLDWVEQGNSPTPFNEVLITGPSKTADIELIMVTGVHGPGTVHVVLLESS